jgi:hypothetical protein
VEVRCAATTVCAAGGVALLAAAMAMDAAWFERHVALPCYYPWAPPWLLRNVRFAAALGGAALLAAAWPLARAAARAAPGAAARVALAVVLALAASEWILRRGGSGAAPWRADKVEFQIGRQDPTFGWVLLPSRATMLGPPQLRVRYAIDAWGKRAASERDVPDPERPSLIVSGESIAVGHGVEYEQSFPALMGKDLGLQVVNVACGGYGSDQALLRFDDALARLRRPAAAVVMFLPIMLSRNVHDYRARLALDRGALRLLPPVEGFFAQLRLRDLLMNELPYLRERTLRESMRLTAAILRETARVGRARGVDPVFAIVSVGPPRPLDAHPEAWVVRELFVDQGLAHAVVDLEAAELLPSDGHPNPAGHRRIAYALEAALQARLSRAQ